MSRDFTQVLLEAVIMGAIVIILGYVVGWITQPFVGVSLPGVCKAWNNKYMLEINLFLIGFILHLITEYSGAGAWYCNNFLASNA